MCNLKINFSLMITQFILPSNLQLKAETIYLSPGTLCINTSADQKSSVCPVCGKDSNRIHSRYLRTLLDLPVSGHMAKVKLKARKYFCDNSVCPRKVFTERFEYEIRPYCRRMIRANDLLARMALELGGNKGAAISGYVGIKVSPPTILRIIKALVIQPKTSTSGIIGIDDWAFKKGRTYGTVIVDLDRKEVIDLLPDREADTLAEWLKKHPEIKTVSRDRYGPYALGVKTGAPNANQVADRFHLLMNLGESTKRIFQAKGKELRAIFTLYNSPKTQVPVLIETDQPAPGKLEGTTHDISTANISVSRQHKFDKVKALLSEGLSLRRIAKITNLARGTVRNYMDLERLGKRQSRASTNLDAFINFLLQDENRGKTYKELHKAITQMGFNGKYTQFCYNMKEVYSRQPFIRTRPTAPIMVKTWTPTRLAIMLYMEPRQLKGDDEEFLKLLFDESPQIKQLASLVRTFKNLFVAKEDGMLRNWIEEAIKSECGLRNFARNLLKDYEAVNNAVITKISNGQVEGQVNRIKNIKRRMYGRAGFQLLRKMILAKSA